MIEQKEGKLVFSGKASTDFNEIQDEIKSRIDSLRSYGKKGMIATFLKMKIVQMNDNDKITSELLKLEFASYNPFTSVSEFEKWREKVYDCLFRADEELRKRYVLKSIGNIVIFICFLLLALAINHFKLFSFVEFDIAERFFTLILLGIAGALIHINMGKITSKGKNIKWKYSNEVFARLVVSFLFPIVMVILLFNNDTGKMQFELNAETWAFLIGYSSTIVGSLLNKLVSLAEKMIDLIN